MARCVEKLCRDDKVRDERPPIRTTRPPLTALPSAGSLVVDVDEPVVIQPTVEERAASAAERAERLEMMAMHPGHMLTISVWGDEIPEGESAPKEPPKKRGRRSKKTEGT